MATASNPLEEFLQSEVDEKALNALVGSLESQLASPSGKDSSGQFLSDNSTGKLINNDHSHSSTLSAGILGHHSPVITANSGRIPSPSVNSIKGNTLHRVSPLPTSNHQQIHAVGNQTFSRVNASSPVLKAQARQQLSDLNNSGRPNSASGPLLLNNGNSNITRPSSVGPVIQKTYSRDSPIRTVTSSPRGSLVAKSQAPVVIRTPFTQQQIQTMSTTVPRGPGMNMNQPRIAPRIVGNPIRIGVNQQAIAPRPGTHNMMGRAHFQPRGHPMPMPPHHDAVRGKSRSTITIPAGFQLPQNAVFIKNEQGQIVMVTPPNAAAAGGISTGQVNAGGQKIVIKPSSGPAPGMVRAGQQPVSVPHPSTHANTASHPHAHPASTAAPVQTAALENIKKCKNFLTTLIKLASSQPKDTVQNVRTLIQGLIDGKVEPENFTHRLQIVLRSSPQPYLVPFLKKSLPQLRQCLASGKMTIEGVNPPRPEALIQTAAPTTSTVPKMSPAAHRVQVTTGQQRPTSVKPAVTPHAALSQSAQGKDKRKFDPLKEDDDINDVATMGGVNLSEESRHLASNSELLSSQMRSCKDEYFLNTGPLLKRLHTIARRHELTDVPPEVAHVISHAVQERLRSYLEKLSTVAEHRLEIYKTDQRVETSADTKERLKFLDELEKLERKRHEDVEREMLLRAAKSRSKIEDPEQAKLKQKARELQQAEMEEVRQREANLTALAAIGPRKKRKLDGSSDSPQTSNANNTDSTACPSTGRATSLRPRVKRVQLRDLVFLLEQDRETTKSNLVYKAFLK